MLMSERISNGFSFLCKRLQIKKAQNGALFSNYADEITFIELPIIKDIDVETEIKFGNIFESLIAITLFSFLRIIKGIE